MLDPDGAWVDELVESERLKATADAQAMVIMAGLCERAEDWLAERRTVGGEIYAPVRVAEEPRERDGTWRGATSHIR